MLVKELSLGVGLKNTDKEWMNDKVADNVWKKYSENTPEYYTPFYKIIDNKYVEVVLIEEDYRM